MNKILKLIIENHQTVKPSAEYRLAQTKCCEIEKAFSNTLSKEQLKAYLNLGYVEAELDTIGQNDFAEYLFDMFAEMR